MKALWRRAWPLLVAFVLFSAAFEIASEGPVAPAWSWRGGARWFVLVVGLQFYTEHRNRREGSN